MQTFHQDNDVCGKLLKAQVAIVAQRQSVSTYRYAAVIRYILFCCAHSNTFPDAAVMILTTNSYFSACVGVKDRGCMASTTMTSVYMSAYITHYKYIMVLLQC